MSIPAFSDRTVLLHDAAARHWLLFRAPTEIYVARSPAEVVRVLNTVQAQVTATGCYAAGFVAYEAAPGFDSALIARSPGEFPLAWFGIYPRPESFAWPDTRPANVPLLWEPSVDDCGYRDAIRRIAAYIAAGDTYQVNYSFRLRSPLTFAPWDLFQQAIAAQGAGYSAYVQLPDWTICSSSPELFWQRQGRSLSSRPMKGTIARGLWSQQDRVRARWLQQSEKNRAENVMIVDMVRNDFNRIADRGSVSVLGLFDLEQYPTLWQMTSTVDCTSDAGLAEVFRAVFPPASIVGAPKARTMEIIAELEDSPRRIYTGSIGFVTRDRAQFNVAIRTVLVDRRAQTAEYGVGGGIVWDSSDRAEQEECHTKARVLSYVEPRFSLLETLLWTPRDGYFLLSLHLQRLQDSAAYFAHALDATAIRQNLECLGNRLPPHPHKVRLLVTKSGAVRLEHYLHQPAATTVRLQLAREPVDAGDRFLYHKTTHRRIYDRALAERGNCDDVLLWNRDGEATETCYCNLVAELDGQLVTPPLHCGLLAGTYRSWLLKQGKISEQAIAVADLKRCNRLFVINSVQQWRSAILISE
ncbi:chorismate-binding protein [Rubidibacter lacunae]|uniref:chorismate-binding protein n=1 Tax=Rubidibacter lacunae TaxID=582514 RepID=UPI0003FFEF03|nr:chorismate-binding protein [Rubidibacter lacunae]